MINTNSDYLTGIALPMIVLGTGNGLTLSPLTNLGIENIEPEDSGSASGLVNAAHQIGGAVGLSTMVSMGTNYVDMNARCVVGMIVAAVFILLAFAITFSRVHVVVKQSSTK